MAESSSEVTSAVLPTLGALSVVVSTWYVTVSVVDAPAARWSSEQSNVWPLLAEQSKAPPSTESTSSRPSMLSVRCRLSASETPSFLTTIVNARVGPPAVTVAELNSLSTERWTFSVTEVCVVLLVFAGFGSVVPSEVTVALFARSVPVSTVEASVTCTMKTSSAPAARPVVFMQVTS